MRLDESSTAQDLIITCHEGPEGEKHQYYTVHFPNWIQLKKVNIAGAIYATQLNPNDYTQLRCIYEF